MLTPTKVCKCGQRIYFIKNPSGKYVPFNVIDKRCHYETCEILKNKQLTNFT